MPISDTVFRAESVAVVGVPPSHVMLFACAHPLPWFCCSLPVPTGNRDPWAQGKLEAKQDAKRGSRASVRERRQRCFLANAGCVGCVSRVRMGRAPLAAFSCSCLWCRASVIPLVPGVLTRFCYEICWLSAESFHLAARQHAPFQREAATLGEVKEGRRWQCRWEEWCAWPGAAPLLGSVARRAPGHTKHKCHRRALRVLPCGQ